MKFIPFGLHSNSPGKPGSLFPLYKEGQGGSQGLNSHSKLQKPPERQGPPSFHPTELPPFAYKTYVGTTGAGLQVTSAPKPAAPGLQLTNGVERSVRCWAQAPGPTGERGLGLRGPAPGAPGAEWRAVLLRDPSSRAACSPPLPGRRQLASPAAWSGARGHGGGEDARGAGSLTAAPGEEGGFPGSPSPLPPPGRRCGEGCWELGARVSVTNAAATRDSPEVGSW